MALVHIVKKELGIDDAEYKNILQRAAGVTSARDLDNEKFRKLMNFFVHSNYYQVNPFGLTMRQKLYIKYLGHQLDWGDTHINNFIHKYYHKPGLDSLSKKEAVKVIESLKNVDEHQKRRQA